MSTNQGTNLTLSNKSYDNAKFIVQIVLPALGVLYASLALLWGFPEAEKVVGSITAIALFLGLVLKISDKGYTPPGTPVGNFTVVDTQDGHKTVKLDLERDPEEFITNDVISFNMRRETEEVAPEDVPE